MRAYFLNEHQEDVVKEKTYSALQCKKDQLSALFKKEIKDQPEYANIVERLLVYHGNVAEELVEKAVERLRRLTEDRGRLEEEVEALREAGRPPEEIIGHLAHSLGLTPTSAPTRARDLVFGFDLASIPQASFVWDPEG